MKLLKMLLSCLLLVVMPNNQVTQASTEQLLGAYGIGSGVGAILVESNRVVFFTMYSIANPNLDWTGWLQAFYGSPSDTITISSPMGIGNLGERRPVVVLYF
jgi:hypothetical protein